MTKSDYDLVITGGRVIDPESGLDALRDVGVRGGTIAAVSADPLEGSERIDASGHVVCPGFIDGHVHVVDLPLGQKGLLRDGVTTALDLEVGAYPVPHWYANLEGKSQVNHGATISAAAARVAAFNSKYLDQTGDMKSTTGNVVTDLFTGVPLGPDWTNRLPTDAELEAILGLIDDGLGAGALGVGPPAGYMVDGFTSQEAIGMAQLAGRYGRFMHVHTRFSSQRPPTTGILAIEEQLATAATYGSGLIVAHMTAQTLNLTAAANQLIDDACAHGVRAIAEIYPYTYGAAGNGVSADYLDPDNYQRNMGRTYSDIIDTQTGKALDKDTYDKMVKNDPNHPVLFYNATDDDMEAAIAHPTTIVGSDAFPFTDPDSGALVSDWDTPWEKVNTHPRTVGTHAKVLRMSRDKKLLPLMSAVSKMSYQYAKFLEDNGVAQMADKGRIKVGADADITVFDPATVRDTSSLDQGKNASPSTGIPHVVVDGTVVVRDSKVLKGVFPGRPIRN
ncbi:MAG: amidohydrolase family protein [Acidimicrobiia bacterium]|nr:amidohydrolase family protein [Acidimicrobiia bacterium]